MREGPPILGITCLLFSKKGRGDSGQASGSRPLRRQSKGHFKISDAPLCSLLNLLNKKPSFLRMMEANVQADGFIHVLIISGMRRFPYRKIARSVPGFDHRGFSAPGQLGEMGQRFAHGEAQLMDAELIAEEGGADLEGGEPSGSAQHADDGGQSLLVMEEERVDPFTEMRERVAVSGIRRPDMQFPQAAQTCKEERQRLGVAAGHQAHVGRNLRQHGIAAEQDAAVRMEERQMPRSMPGRLHRQPDPVPHPERQIFPDKRDFRLRRDLGKKPFKCSGSRASLVPGMPCCRKNAGSARSIEESAPHISFASRCARSDIHTFAPERS